MQIEYRSYGLAAWFGPAGDTADEHGHRPGGQRPVTFHQNQNNAGTNSHRPMFKTTPTASPAFAPRVSMRGIRIAATKVASIGPKNTDPILLIASISVVAMWPVTNASARHTPPQKIVATCEACM